MGGDRGRPWRRGIARRQRKAPPVEECRRNSGGGATSKTLAGKPFPIAVEWLVRTGLPRSPGRRLCVSVHRTYAAGRLRRRAADTQVSSLGYSDRAGSRNREPSPLERQRYGSTSGRDGE